MEQMSTRATVRGSVQEVHSASISEARAADRSMCEGMYRVPAGGKRINQHRTASSLLTPWRRPRVEVPPPPRRQLQPGGRPLSGASSYRTLSSQTWHGTCQHCKGAQAPQDLRTESYASASPNCSARAPQWTELATTPCFRSPKAQQRAGTTDSGAACRLSVGALKPRTSALHFAPSGCR